MSISYQWLTGAAIGFVVLDVDDWEGNGLLVYLGPLVLLFEW